MQYLRIPILLVSILLSAFEGAGQEFLCTDCHDDITGRPVMHVAIDGACDNCHEATGETHPLEGVKGFLLVDQPPQLCYYCHEEQTPMEKIHRPVMEGNCLDCHDVHSSEAERLLVAKLPGLCLGCHDRSYYTDSSVTENIARKMVPGNTVHSALYDGECQLCHLPHGSDFNALLIDRYPEDIYVSASPDSFALCFLCHDSELMLSERSDWATNFRHGKQNLHFLHIRGEKGRSCHLCHDVHAAQGAYLIKAEIPFGNWEMKMNYRPVENGGSCLPGCHGLEVYDRTYTEKSE